MNFGRKIIVWYDRSLKLWTAVYQDADSCQIGSAGYGPNRADAIADLKYQNPTA